MRRTSSPMLYPSPQHTAPPHRPLSNARPPRAARGARRYHPHFHGLVDTALLSGASGLIVVQGIEQARARPPPALASRPTR